MTAKTLVDAATAIGALRVSRATLYAYASRGLIGTVPDPADSRRRLYRAADIERLRKTQERGRKPAAIAAQALDWGPGGLASRLTLLENGRLYYRGQEATRLAAQASLEEVARLLWDCGRDDPFVHSPDAPDGRARAFARQAADVPPIERCRALLPLLPTGARALWNRDASRLGSDAAALLRVVAGAVLGIEPDVRPLHAQIAQAWHLPGGGHQPAAELVRAALVLLADHELNASTFAARVVASTGASLSACVSAGLAALTGPLHGGASALAEHLFEEAARTADPRAVVEARLHRGEPIPAFGHPLYPEGDPRAAFLLDRLPPDPARDTLIAAVAEIGGQAPNIDFALAAMGRSLHLPANGGLMLFAIARTVGWIAHALEQNSEKKLIRPRAEYVGIRP